MSGGGGGVVNIGDGNCWGLQICLKAFMRPLHAIGIIIVHLQGNFYGTPGTPGDECLAGSSSVIEDCMESQATLITGDLSTKKLPPSITTAVSKA